MARPALEVMTDRDRGLARRLHVDGVLLAALAAILALGGLVLYSAAGGDDSILVRQGIRIAVGVALMLALAQVPPWRVAHWAPLLYVAGVVLLLAVPLVGTGRGAERWLDLGVVRLQPSEPMRLILPLALAAYLSERPVPPRLRHIAVCLAMIAVPVLLVARQPDLGTAVLLAAGGVLVLYFGGVPGRYFAIAGVLALASLPLLWFGLHDYQRQRVLTLLNPQQDPLGAGYHIIQSKIAVGSGGLFGKGWMNGTQSQLEFLPERTTDFIFAVLCEELGFIGAVVLLALYLVLVVRGMQIAARAQGRFGALLVASLALSLAIAVTVNVGMVLGQLPVVGSPLPFVSYGGSSLLTLLAACGLMMSVHTHKRLLGGP